MKKWCFTLALIVAILLPLEAAAQKRQTRTAQRSPSEGAAAEPVRSVSGEMQGSRILAQTHDGRAAFSYLITKAEIVDGRLQFQGTAKSASKAEAFGGVNAVLVGTLARSANPWPSAGDRPPSRRASDANIQRQGREARNPEAAGEVGQLAQATQPTARTTPPPTTSQGQRPAGEVNEQTQSLYAATDTGSGCEVMYLKLQLPAPLGVATPGQPLQLGVVLAPVDNQLGHEINQYVCRIVRGLAAGQSQSSVEGQLARLNRLLIPGK